MNDDKCILSCATRESLNNKIIYYEGHVIRYLKSQCDIDNLPMGLVFLRNFEKVSWVLLKCDYDITANSKEQLNNHTFKKNKYRWNKIHNTNRQIFYNISEKKHEERFVQDMDIRNNINIIFNQIAI